MGTRVLGASLLAGIVMIVWTFVVNGLFGFKSSLDMKQIPDEAAVYAVLKAHVVEPGRYTCNPSPTEEGRFPEGEPAFGVLYGGVGHEAAGRLMLAQLPLFFVLPLIGTWLLSRCDAAFLRSFGRKVLFFAAIGILLGLSKHMMEFGIASHPLDDAVLHTLHDLALWTVMGLVVAWRLRVPAS